MKTLTISFLLSSLLGGCAAAPTIAPASPEGVPTAAVPPAPVGAAEPSPSPADQRRATETDPAQLDHRVWVTNSDALPFQLIHVAAVPEPGGARSWCATTDGRALGARPILVEGGGVAFRLVLKGEPAAPANAACPRAFPPSGMSDGVLRTSDPREIRCALEGDRLHCQGGRAEVVLEPVKNLGLRSFDMRAAGLDALAFDPNAELMVLLDCAKCEPGWKLPTMTQAGSIYTVHVAFRSLAFFLQANPRARVEFDKEMFLEGEGSDH